MSESLYEASGWPLPVVQQNPVGSIKWAIFWYNPIMTNHKEDFEQKIPGYINKWLCFMSWFVIQEICDGIIM